MNNNDYFNDKLQQDLQELRAEISRTREEITQLDRALMSGELIDGEPVDQARLKSLRESLTSMRRTHDELANKIEGEISDNAGFFSALQDFFIDYKIPIVAVVGIVVVVAGLKFALDSQKNSEEEAAKIRKGMGLPSVEEQNKMFTEMQRAQSRSNRQRIEIERQMRGETRQLRGDMGDAPSAPVENPAPSPDKPDAEVKPGSP